MMIVARTVHAKRTVIKNKKRDDMEQVLQEKKKLESNFERKGEMVRETERAKIRNIEKHLIWGQIYTVLKANISPPPLILN